MSRVCAVSGKKALSGNKRSHSMHASRRKWNVNLQKVKVANVPTNDTMMEMDVL